MADDGVHATEAGRDRAQPQPVAERHSCLPTAVRRDRHDGAVPASLRPDVEQLARQLVLRMAREAGVVDPLDLRVVGDGLGKRERRCAVPRDTQRQRGQASVQQERLVRREHAAEVDARLSHGSDQVDVTDDDAAGGVRVAAEILRRRVHDE
jgi:hypothetical protein